MGTTEKKQAKPRACDIAARAAVERGTGESPALCLVESDSNYIRVTFAPNPSEIEERGAPWHKVEVNACRDLFGDKKNGQYPWRPATVHASFNPSDIESQMRCHATALMAIGVAQFIDYLTGVKDDVLLSDGATRSLEGLRNIVTDRLVEAEYGTPGKEAQ